MINNVDFVYEYSDLNLFHTRVKVLTGLYKDLVFEYGGSVLEQIKTKKIFKNNFKFDYILYEIPEKFDMEKLKKDKAFIEFMAYLIVDVISCRNKDPKEKEKLDEVASVFGKTTHEIYIDPKYYPKNKLQTTVVGVQEF